MKTVKVLAEFEIETKIPFILLLEFDINYLMGMALNKIGFLQFGMMLDMWRWRTLNGSITPDEYNHQWWKLRFVFLYILLGCYKLVLN